MSRYVHHESVGYGITYLSATYPMWLRSIDELTLDMYDPRWHVLAQVHGVLVYEALEIIFWDREELISHGFMPWGGRASFSPLTAEWHFQIRQLKKEWKQQ